MTDPRPAIRQFIHQSEHEKWYETVERISLWVEREKASEFDRGRMFERARMLCASTDAVPQGDGHP